jgi:hypothetical protein
MCSNGPGDFIFAVVRKLLARLQRIIYEVLRTLVGETIRRINMNYFDTVLYVNRGTDI